MPRELLLNVVKVMQRLIHKDLYVAAHKCMCFSTPITWCGEVFSADGVSHKPGRFESVLAIRRPEMGVS